MKNDDQKVTSSDTLLKAQKAFAGAAKEIGVSNEDEVQALVNALRSKQNSEAE